MAGIVDTHAQALTSGRAMTDGTVHLLAAEHELDGPINHARGHDAENLRPRDQALAAEAAAEERAADMNVCGWNAKQASDARLRQSKALAWRVNCEPVAVPGRNDRVWLDGIVVLRWCLVGYIDHLGGCSQRRLHVAVFDDGGIADAYGGRDKAFGCIEAHTWSQERVFGREQRGAFGCGFQCFSNHDRDRLIGIAHTIVLQDVHSKGKGIRLRVRV